MFANDFYTLEINNGLHYKITGGSTLTLQFPVFQIEGHPSGQPENWKMLFENQLSDGRRQLKWEGTYPCGAQLELEILAHPETPFLRFRYSLSAQTPLRLTKVDHQENLEYFSYEAPEQGNTWEIRLSEYDFRLHSYALSELPAFSKEPDAMGPILVEEGSSSFLTAYEHGSQYPDKFISYCKTGKTVQLRAVKGNTWDGYPLDQEPFETVWFQLGGISGGKEKLAQVYRKFQLSFCSPNRESRMPYIYYNTWAYQERNKFYNHATYLASMNEKRMLEEIDAAHALGVDVFVIDTGWYEKTGDWVVDKTRFPRGLSPIREKLQRYEMKLGLWFNPTVAASSSRMLKHHRENIAEHHGQKAKPFPIWETEESFPMCLVSHGMWEAFAQELIRLYQELGVTYFKWDAVELYGCDSGNHLHGTPDSTEQERRDCYAFRIGQFLSKVVDQVCQACPQAIVDMDITECCRYFGLGFLSSGKFFAINNGPYYQDLDISVPEEIWTNAFVHPGPARPRLCRGILDYDRWFPSVLMMTHYLPDDPEDSQMVNLASLVLGQNGIWGDLPTVSPQGKELFHQVLSVYKRVRWDITEAYPVTLGHAGSTWEVHEKISPAGRGVVCLFASYPGTYSYRMQNKPTKDATVFGPARIIAGDPVEIQVEIQKPGATLVFFE